MADSLVVCDLRYKRLCELLDDTQYKAYAISDSSCLTEIGSLTFSIPVASPKSKYIVNENLINFNGIYYVIKTINLECTENGMKAYTVSCSNLSVTLSKTTVTMEQVTPTKAEILMRKALAYRHTDENAVLVANAKQSVEDKTEALRNATLQMKADKVIADKINSTQEEKDAYATSLAAYEAAIVSLDNADLDLINITNSADSSSIPTIGWTFGEITVDDSKVFGLESVEDTSFNILLNIAQKYEGILKFDTVTKKVDLLAMETVPVLEMSLTNSLTGVKITYDTTELITRLYCFGNTTKDGVELTILDVNPTGKGYIDNFSYYTSQGYTLEDINASPELFIKTSVFRDTNYTDAQKLYDAGEEKLDKLAVPVVTVSITGFDLSGVYDYNYHKIKIGDAIKIIDEDSGQEFICYVTKNDINYDERHILNLELTNKIVYSSVLSQLFKRVKDVGLVLTDGAKIDIGKLPDMEGLYMPADKVIFRCVEEYPPLMEDNVVFFKYVPET